MRQRERRKAEAWSSSLSHRLIVKLTGQFAAHDRGTLGERLELAERHRARQVFHAAIGRRYKALRRDMAKPGAQPLSDSLGALDGPVAEIEDAEQDRLLR